MNPMAEHYGERVVTSIRVVSRRNPKDSSGKVGWFSCSCGYVYRRGSEEGAQVYVYSRGSAFEAQTRALAAGGSGLNEAARVLGVNARFLRRYIKRFKINTPWKEVSLRSGRHNPGAAVRARWITLQHDDPGITRSQLARRLSSEYHWLRRHDYDWLQAHSPDMIRGQVHSPRIDWEIQDLELTSSLSKAAETLR
jgi:hypothetical protein